MCHFFRVYIVFFSNFFFHKNDVKDFAQSLLRICVPGYSSFENELCDVITDSELCLHFNDGKSRSSLSFSTTVLQ